MNTGKKNTRTRLVGIFRILIACTFLISCDSPSGQEDLQINESIEGRILDATIQINMYVLTNRENLAQDHPNIQETRACLDQGRGHYRVEGLGTLIDFQGQTMILTHDHWGELMQNADLIEILDDSGSSLYVLSNQGFRRLVIFADGGSMILKAPDGLRGVPIQLGDSSQVSNGQELLLVRRLPGTENRVDLIAARVENTTTFKNQAAWELHTLHGDHIVPGDSGGGVWLNGQIVGNNWASNMVAERGFLGMTGKEMVPNGTVYAAQYPVEIQIQLEENLNNLAVVGLMESKVSSGDIP